MRRTTVWLWITGAVLLASGILVFGGWWALRQWPAVIGPRLSPSLAYAIAGWGPLEASAARSCFGDHDGYWVDHPMTPAQADARNAVLCAELRGPRKRQLAVLAFISDANSAGAITGFVPTSPERDALVFALTSSPDRDLRESALACWRRTGPSRIHLLRRLSRSVSGDLSRLSPDGWVAGPAGANAWQMTILHSNGYDHKTPHRYRDHLQKLLARLIAGARDSGQLADDPRDDALALLTVADAFAMTNDPELKPVVERGLKALMADPMRLERLWLEDTTAAVLTAWAGYAIHAAGTDAGPLKQALSSGLDAWLTTRDESGTPPWFSRGQAVPATTQERWGALMIGLHFMGRQPGLPTTPPDGILDQRDSTPFGRYLIRLGSGLHSGGPAWAEAFDQRSKTLLTTQLITPDHQPPEGFWPATATVSSTWETTFALLELSVERHRSPPTMAP
jgi:hypothetical protein